MEPEKKDLTKENVESIIKEVIKPALKADGGDIELLEINKSKRTIKVRLTGACSGCPMSEMTLKNFVENLLKNRIFGIKTVESV